MSDPPSKEPRAAVLAMVHNLKTLALKLYSNGFFTRDDLQVIRQTLYMAGAEIAQKADLPCRDCPVSEQQ